MNHPFYNKTAKEQQNFLNRLGLGALSILALAILISWLTGIYLIAIVSFPILLSIVAPFFDMPSLKKSGRITYYSPLFVAEQAKDGLVKIHGGTLFDYYFVIDKSLNGRQRTNHIMKLYIQGLLNFLEEHQAKHTLNVRGTSYIINQRTAQKIGFQVIETEGLQHLLMLLNYPNITASNSIAKAKLSFPKLNNTKTFEAPIRELLKRKEDIEKLYHSL